MKNPFFLATLALAACTSHPLVTVGHADASPETSPSPTTQDVGPLSDAVVDGPLGGAGGTGGGVGATGGSGTGGSGTGGTVGTGGVGTGGGGGRSGTGGGSSVGGNGTGGHLGSGGSGASGGSLAAGGRGGLGGRGGRNGAGGNAGYDGGTGDGGVAVCGGKSPTTYREVCDLCGSAVTCVGFCSDLGCVEPSLVTDEGCDVGQGVGQIYTATTTGTLVGVAISLFNYDGAGPLRVELRAVDQGNPGAVLAETTLTNGEPKLDQVIMFPNTVQQVAGQQYLIFVSYPGTVSGSRGMWNGSMGNLYKGGSLVISIDGQSWRAEPDTDQHFRVFVLPS